MAFFFALIQKQPINEQKVVSMKSKPSAKYLLQHKYTEGGGEGGDRSKIKQQNISVTKWNFIPIKYFIYLSFSIYNFQMQRFFLSSSRYLPDSHWK